MLKANQDKLTLNHHNAGPRSRVPLLGVGMHGTLIGSFLYYLVMCCGHCSIPLHAGSVLTRQFFIAT